MKRNKNMNTKIILSVIVFIVAVGGAVFFLSKSDVPLSESQPNAEPAVNNIVNNGGNGSSTNQNNEPEPEVILEALIKGFAFEPSTLTIKAGQKIRWTNQDSTGHNVKADVFYSDILAKGESFIFQFDNKGAYQYFCGVHPSMKGEIIVE